MRLQLNDTTFSVYEQGQSEPALVFLHYFGGSSRTWHEVIIRLAPSYRCIAPDLRGFGESDTTTTGYSIDEQADDVAALLRTMDVQRFVLVGHSMGGKIALALAARRPPGLEALVLLAPSPPTPEPMTDSARAQLLMVHGNIAAIQNTINSLTPHPLPPQLFTQEVENHLRASVPAWRAWLEHGSREDISATSGVIDVPTLVLSGSADTSIPADVLQREVVARIAGARLVSLSDVGHLSPLEAPEAVATQIRALIEGTAASVISSA